MYLKILVPVRFFLRNVFRSKGPAIASYPERMLEWTAKTLTMTMAVVVQDLRVERRILVYGEAGVR